MKVKATVLILVAAITVAIGLDTLHIYVSGYFNHNIVRFDDMEGTGWTTYGSNGSGIGEFRQPSGVVVDSEGRIYIAGYENHRIVRMDNMDGDGWITYGSYGSGVGQFSRPTDIMLDHLGRIYIADCYNNRIVRIDDMTGAGWTEYGSAGSGVGQFNFPVYFTMDRNSRIYIGDHENHRVVRINDMAGTGWVSYGSYGSGVGQFSRTRDIVIDKEDRIIIADCENDRIVRIDDMTGSGWTEFGSGFLDYPIGMAIDYRGRIYISERNNHRITRIDDISGAGLVTFGHFGSSGFGALNGPAGIFAIGNIETSVEEQPDLPKKIGISAYPNPFNSAVTISFDGVGDGSPVPIDIDIYDLSGRKVDVIARRVQPDEAISYHNEKDCHGLRPRNDNASAVIWRPEPSLPSGVYLVRACFGQGGPSTGSGSVVSKRVVYLK